MSPSLLVHDRVEDAVDADDVIVAEAPGVELALHRVGPPPDPVFPAARAADRRARHVLEWQDLQSTVV